MEKKKLKVAIVYDWIDKWGGVERVLLNLHEMYPQATFFTSYYDKEGAQWAKKLKIRTSFIQKLPNSIKKNRILSLILYPYAFESFDFSNYDLVISVTSSFAKAVITKSETLHVCYVLTPTRYFYFPETYLTSRLTKLGYLMLPRWREWDFTAAQRPDYLLSISKTVQRRVKKYYQRNSEVIYPPFDFKYWSTLKIKAPNFKVPDNFFLVVSRLEPYKKVELAVEAFNRNGENLVIIGKGTQLAGLKNKARENILFVNDISDEQLAWFYKNARALIMPQVEEFGYVGLEAQYFACPVISYSRGGATETVIDGKTGIFFNKQSSKALAEAVARFKSIEYNLKKDTRTLAKENLKQFSKEIFEKKFEQFIQSKK